MVPDIWLVERFDKGFAAIQRRGLTLPQIHVLICQGFLAGLAVKVLVNATTGDWFDVLFNIVWAPAVFFVARNMFEFQSHAETWADNDVLKMKYRVMSLHMRECLWIGRVALAVLEPMILGALIVEFDVGMLALFLVHSVITLQGYAYCAMPVDPDLRQREFKPVFEGGGL